MVVAYCNGTTQNQIALDHGVHIQTVRRNLREAGVVLRDRRGSLEPDEVQRVRQLHAQGMTDRELGRRFGVAHTTIARWLRASTDG